MKVLTRTADAYAQERLAVQRRIKDFRGANKELQTNQPNSKSNSSNNSKSEEQAKWEAINKDRQARIEYDIKNHIFDPKKYVKEVRANCCVYHNNFHALAQCTRVNNLVEQYPNQKYYRPAHLKLAPPILDPQLAQAPPTAKHTQVSSSSPAPSAIVSNNPFTALADFPPPPVVNDNNNDSVTSYSTSSLPSSHLFTITCKAVSCSTTKHRTDGIHPLK